MFQKFVRLVKHPVKFRVFLLRKLPSAFFSGVRVVNIDEKECVVLVKYRWFTTNPFKSTYFACLGMAAEMSTGALAMGHLFGAKPRVGMLIIKNEAEYFKKAKGVTFFTCSEGLLLKSAIEQARTSGETVNITVRSVGKTPNGEEVAAFSFTWSFKAIG